MVKNTHDSSIMTHSFLARAATHENWCVEWWLDEMYLRQRLPLSVNSSPGMIVHRNYSRSKSENAAFIAEIIKLVIKYKSHVENNELNEQSTGQLAGSHLCMAQARIHRSFVAISRIKRGQKFGQKTIWILFSINKYSNDIVKLGRIVTFNYIVEANIFWLCQMEFSTDRSLKILKVRSLGSIRTR